MAANGSDISSDFDGSGGWVDRTAYDGPYLVTGDGQLPKDPFTDSADWSYDNTTGSVHSASTLVSIGGAAYLTW
jgi:hypothetical protein